ncbi:hypothetical protein R9X47_20615 [Wukongibacter baidiensis]|uniref:hypothetical protein n=1 Tax=Wukongibacter baidiensis TaxID=1723361 RepID=UPI003D7F495F
MIETEAKRIDKEVLKHSRVGISSFVISIISGIMMWGSGIIGGYLEITTPGGLHEESMEAFIIGLVFLLGLFLSLIGTGLGIFGTIQKNRKKLFAVLGLIFNAVLILFGIVLMIFGSTV